MSWAEESADPSQVDRRNIILLVDDAPENLRILSECLRDKYTIMFAKNGTDALRLALRQPPARPDPASRHHARHGRLRSLQTSA